MKSQLSEWAGWTLVVFGCLVFLCTGALWAQSAPAASSHTLRGTDMGPVHSSPSLTSVAETTRSVSAGAKVLLLMSEGGVCTSPLQSLLLSYSDIASVGAVDYTYSLPTLAQLQAYDVVICWTNYNPADPVGAGNLLADYVDAGGKVIISVFSFSGADYWGLSGRVMTATYTPLLAGEYDHYTWANLGTYDASSPIMQGVTSVQDVYRDYTTLSAGATLVASWDDGENLVATKGCIVGIDLYPGCEYVFSGNVGALYHNAVNWLMAGCSTGPTYDLSFLDDLGRSSLCLSSTSGSYLWKVLKGTGAGTSYTGTGQVANTATHLTLTNVAGASQRISFNYYKAPKSASGYCQSSAQYSCLVDANTANDPPCR